MALQHLYSRVPARLSLFNKTDGYDTFACSEDLSREYIEKEIALVSENQPTRSEAVLIRDGKLPPVYCQRADKEGNIIQSCMSFIPRDYTGERSSYMVHSLVLDAEEKAAVIESPDNLQIDPEKFIKDFALLNIDEDGKFPDPNYPVYEYIAKPRDVSYSITERYDSKSIKFMINAVIAVFYGKCRAIFPVLPVDHGELSASAVDFINAFMQIIPYHVRAQLSFVTDAADTSKFSQFKIRFLPENVAIPNGKGVGILFRSRTAVGMREEEVSANLQLVEFFYSLFGNDAMRREFLIFVDNAVKSNPKLAVLNEKNLNNLVFLFMQCSGMFHEANILPNDVKVEEFIGIYDKYRTALSDESRVNALRCLKRYPASHIEIPKKVFSKVTKFYTSEPEVTKRIIMNVVLDLIHTDVMREKLFAFIKSIYDGETAEMRVLINSHLASVYYGGFLQIPLFNFFTEHFDNEPVETQDTIIDKFLLTIRTPSVQQEIIDFFDNKYDFLTHEQKERFYNTCLQMLPESDKLAGHIVEVVDRKIIGEPPEFQNEFAEGLCRAIENDQRRKNPKMLAFVTGGSGFCSSRVTEKIFGEWANTKVFDRFVEIITEKPVTELAVYLAEIRRLVPDMPPETAERLLTAIKSKYSEDQKKYDLFALIESEEYINKTVPELDPRGAAFLREFSVECLHPRIIVSLNDVFLPKYRDSGVQRLSQYAHENEYVIASKEFATVKHYIAVEVAYKKCEAYKIISHSAAFPQDKNLRYNIAQCLRGAVGELTDPDQKHATAAAAMFASIDLLGKGAFAFETAAEKLRESFVIPEKGADKARFAAEQCIIVAIITVADAVVKKGGAHKGDALSDGSGLGSIVASFAREFSRTGVKWLESALTSGELDKELANYCLDKAKNSGEPKRGLFGKLFRK